MIVVERQICRSKCEKDEPCFEVDFDRKHLIPCFHCPKIVYLWSEKS